MYVAFNKNVIFSCSLYISFECFNILTWLCTALHHAALKCRVLSSGPYNKAHSYAHDYLNRWWHTSPSYISTTRTAGLMNRWQRKERSVKHDKQQLNFDFHSVLFCGANPRHKSVLQVSRHQITCLLGQWAVFPETYSKPWISTQHFGRIIEFGIQVCLLITPLSTRTSARGVMPKYKAPYLNRWWPNS